MLTLSTGSSCDVCAEEYGPHLVPHSIPCGHVLCENCCTTIVEKTSPRLTPACPFCRETFTNDAVRMIRIDFSLSGQQTPRRRGPLIEDDFTDDVDLATRKEERILLMEAGCSRTRAEARRLEDKVAKVAAKKCSVEEVSTLHKELQDWLNGEVTDQTSSLSLSAALIRAILMNHIAHSEASKASKLAEANLKGKVDDMEITNQKLEAELRRQRVQYSQKSQECQSLAFELNRLKGKANNGSKSLSPPTSPPPPPLHAPTARSPLSRFTSSSHSSPQHSTHGHGPMRSASVQPQSGSISHRPTPSLRSATPAPTHPYSRSDTLTPRPPLPSKPRRLSTPSPPAMHRSLSNTSSDDETSSIHQRWIPSTDPDRYPHRTQSRMASAGHAPYRYPTPAHS